jgi:hypothetical protein
MNSWLIFALIPLIISLGIIPILPYIDAEEPSIPSWIKNNAGWWANGDIDDNSFVQGLQFLIKEGIMKVES